MTQYGRRKPPAQPGGFWLKQPRALSPAGLTVLGVNDEQFLPYTFGYLAIFLAAVCIGCGIIASSTPMLAGGAVAAVVGPVYLMVARKARSGRSEQ